MTWADLPARRLPGIRSAVRSFQPDGVEATLNHAVCRGQVRLVSAQRAIARNWKTAEHVLGFR
jgi:hypothetical protein